MPLISLITADTFEDGWKDVHDQAKLRLKREHERDKERGFDVDADRDIDEIEHESRNTKDQHTRSHEEVSRQERIKKLHEKLRQQKQDKESAEVHKHSDDTVSAAKDAHQHSDDMAHLKNVYNNLLESSKKHNEMMRKLDRDTATWARHRDALAAVTKHAVAVKEKMSALKAKAFQKKASIITAAGTRRPAMSEIGVRPSSLGGQSYSEMKPVSEASFPGGYKIVKLVNQYGHESIEKVFTNGSKSKTLLAGVDRVGILQSGKIVLLVSKTRGSSMIEVYDHDMKQVDRVYDTEDFRDDDDNRVIYRAFSMQSSPQPASKSQGATGKATLLSQILMYSDPMQKARFAYDLSEADYDKLLTQAETAYKTKKIDKPTFILVHTALNTAVDWHEAGKAPKILYVLPDAKSQAEFGNPSQAKPAKTMKSRSGFHSDNPYAVEPDASPESAVEHIVNYGIDVAGDSYAGLEERLLNQAQRFKNPDHESSKRITAPPGRKNPKNWESGTASFRSKYPNWTDSDFKKAADLAAREAKKYHREGDAAHEPAVLG